MLAAIGALSLAACAPEPEAGSPAPVQADIEGLLAGTATAHPPVILITIDTLRADRLSSYGSDRVSTPHIDRLAAEGVRFANASSTVPFTLPAHSSIMTGLYPPTHGVRENVGYVLGADRTTLAERFRDAGYRTGGFVSAFVLDARWGIGRGFDTYVDDFDLDSMAGANLGSVQRSGPETIANALEWLDEAGSSGDGGAAGDPSGQPPFFLWLHLFDPHDPYEPPEPFRTEHEGRPYDGEVAYTDSLIGGFRAALEQRGLFDESVVVLTADHGEGLGDHGESYHGFFVYDSTVHVPLIVRLPGGVEGGRVVTDAVSHVDIAPTLAELLGLEAGVGQGRSLLPSMEGLEHRDSRRGVYAESFYALDHYGWAPLRSLRTADYKYIETPDPELYALLEDPGELTTVLLERRDTSRELRAAALELAAALDRAAPDATPEPDLDEQALAQLQALGYLAGRGAAEGRPTDGPRADAKTKAHLPPRDHEGPERLRQRRRRGRDRRNCGPRWLRTTGCSTRTSSWARSRSLPAIRSRRPRTSSARWRSIPGTGSPCSGWPTRTTNWAGSTRRWSATGVCSRSRARTRRRRWPWLASTSSAAS